METTPRNIGTLTPVECINSRLLPAVAGRNRKGGTPDASDANVNIARPTRLRVISVGALWNRIPTTNFLQDISEFCRKAYNKTQVR